MHYLWFNRSLEGAKHLRISLGRGENKTGPDNTKQCQTAKQALAAPRVHSLSLVSPAVETQPWIPTHSSWPGPFCRLYPVQGCLRLPLPVGICLVQPNASSVSACNAMIITFTQFLSIKFTLSMPIYCSLYWRNISFLWIHIFNKESKQRDVLYHCNCKLYLWFRQSFAKCCKTHPLLKLPYLLTVSSKSKAKTSSCWLK